MTLITIQNAVSVTSVIELLFFLNFISFTSIMKQVIELIILITGMGSAVMWSLKWDETGIPRENPRVWRADHRTLSHTPWRRSSAGHSSDK